MSVLKAFNKSPVERKKYTLNYICWLETTETVAGFTITVTPVTDDAPLVVSGAFVDPTFKRVTTYLGGGKAGTLYTVRFVATTSLGQIKADDLQLKVQA
jgi:hypothetical protein